MAKKSLYVALIGINAYQNANSLNGCVTDILNIDQILRGLSAQQIGGLEYVPLYLLAPREGDVSIRDYETQQQTRLNYIDPTFSNITNQAFDHLCQAKDNDICLFYYSGHGSYIGAPEVFWHTKSTYQNETLVCMDSRSTARDIVDKELAYLFHKTLKDKPDVHCLVIMDCCHSGDNTKGPNSAKAPVYRQEPPTTLKFGIENYLGFSEGFFQIKEGKAYYPISKYVHLAACRDNEKAQELAQGGLFSLKLKELFNNGGTGYSYRNLMQSLSSTVSISNGNQNPVAFSFDPKHLDQPFLGGKIVPYKPSYEVRYLHGQQLWQLQAGNLQGLVPSSADRKTLIRLENMAIEAEVDRVDDFTATLKGDQLELLNKESNIYRAFPTQLAIQRMVIGYSDSLKDFPELEQKLKDSFSESSHLYIKIDPSGQDTPDYLIDLIQKQEGLFYVLTQSINDIPVFKSESDPHSFLNNVDAVAKWVYINKLESAQPVFDAEDFIFNLEKIEGQEFAEDTIDFMNGVSSQISPGSELELTYKNNHQPAFRLSISINPNSNLSECYIQALYLDSLFGISDEYSEFSTNRLDRNGSFQLKQKGADRFYNAIPLLIDKEYEQYNINEIVEHLKIYVSTQPNLNLEGFRQKSLELEPKKSNFQRKGTGFANSKFTRKEGWAVFNFSIRIIGPKKEILLKSGQETDFAAFSIKAPNGFEAFATAITLSDDSTLRNLVPQKLSKEETKLFPEIMPAIWGDALTESLPFNDALGNMKGSGVVALEIGVPEGNKMPSLGKGEELVIKPKKTASSRSVGNYEETIVPFGFDAINEIYFPLGYTDTDGDIHINQLPQATPGSLVSEAITSRSIGGSIKMYFKKLLRKSTNSLTLHTYNNGWKTISVQAEIKKVLQTLGPSYSLPIFIHGILGDTRSIFESIQEEETFAGQYPAILTYDYENLSTSLTDTARLLNKNLVEVGFGEEGIPKLSIIAHSMGGLLSRIAIEQESCGEWVEKLILVGTPNGGSEWSKSVIRIVDGANFLLSHALNVTGPLKYAITGLSFFVKKLNDPMANLKALGIDSELIKELKASAPPDGIPYFLVGSDTGLLVSDYNGNDPFLRKVAKALKNRVVFPGLDNTIFKKLPNDMAVTVESMQAIQKFENKQKMAVLPGDHISYFSEPYTRKHILNFLNR